MAQIVRLAANMNRSKSYMKRFIKENVPMSSMESRDF
jgi:hypothetical protein